MICRLHCIADILVSVRVCCVREGSNIDIANNQCNLTRDRVNLCADSFLVLLNSEKFNDGDIKRNYVA